MTIDDADISHLRRCIELAVGARERGDEPFGSVLVSGEGAVLATDDNKVITTRDITAHPELALARWASMRLDAGERAAATMYTSCEHCAMCAGAFYWSGLGRIVFALSSEQVIAMLPEGASVLALTSREIFARGDRPIAVEGPVAEVETEARAALAGYWG
jgi:tRNA(Arg) A34 adenosine deaminase TadA